MTMQTDIAALIKDATTSQHNAQNVADSLQAVLTTLKQAAALVTEGSAPVVAPAPPAA